MRLFTLLAVGSSLGLAGCVHTVVDEEQIPVAAQPYRKILVCALTPEAARAARVEDRMAERLRKHRVESQPCHDFLMTGASEAVKRQKIREWEAVLVFQRQHPAPRPEPTTREIWEKRESVEALEANERTTATVANLSQLIAMYQPPAHAGSEEAGAKPSDERVIPGVVALISVAEDRIVWRSGGAIVGSVGQPVEEFIAAAIRRTETQLRDAKLIPR